jgi:phage repressor protein C with HTH and peptisase S24 domain
MQPILKRGMRLIVSVIQPVGDGDLAYVQLKSGERLAKIATRQTDGWLLTSANPAYPPRAVRIDEIQHIHKVAYVRFLK